MADNIPAPLRARLRAMSFNPSDARDAIRGVAIPGALGRRAMRLCVVRGIRYHDSLTQSPRAKALRLWPEFARALNARAIMSDRIPDMQGGDDVPYCIWHLDTASEATYRELVRRYPYMAYQVACACAVVGYRDLYQELEDRGRVLPDVAIVEEARACGSQDIFKAITSQPVRYCVMDDYSRSILMDPQPSGLNGDAIIQPMLNVKQEFETPYGDEDCVISAGDSASDEELDDDDGSDNGFFSMIPESGFRETIYNITEDMNIDEFATPEPEDTIDLPMAECLVKPLPIDLMVGNKNILILAAAYSGNVDWYACLQRPYMVDHEAGCVVRGIYHDPFFVMWWTTQPLPPQPARHANTPPGSPALSTHGVMSNDLSQLTPDVPQDHFPYLIWYLVVARPSTYKEVARRCPTMRPAVLRAAIYAKDRDLFDEQLDAVEPDLYLLSEVRTHDDEDGDEVRPSYFTRRLLARAEALGLDIQGVQSDRRGGDEWKRFSVKTGGSHGMPESGNWLFGGPAIVGAAQDPGIYNEVWANASTAELFVSAPETWRPKNGGVQVDYDEWPQ